MDNENPDRKRRKPGEALNRITEIRERLKEMLVTYSTSGSTTPVAGAGEESYGVYEAIEQALPLIEVLESPFVNIDAADIDRTVDDADRLLLLAGDLEQHARTAGMAAAELRKAAESVKAMRAKVEERARLIAAGEDPDPIIRH